MFRAALLLSLATLALGLSVEDLKVSVQAVSSSVDSIDDIVISAIVANPTDQDIRVLAINNILDTSPTQSFSVSRNQEDLLFAGIRATYDLSSDGVYKTIPARSSIAVNHTNLAALYDFETAGTGKFSFAPNTLFQAAPDTEPVVIDAPAVTVEVKKDVQQRRLVPETSLSTPSCADAGRNQFITTALADARARAGGAATDIRSHPTSSEFNTYFGGNNLDDIWFRFDIIAGDLASSGTRKIGCTDPANICPGNSVIAYTLIVTSGGQIVSSDIFTCNIFFTSVLPTSSVCGSGGFDSTTSSTGGVILHELSHATSGTSDLGYGCSVTAGLSVQNKRNNADNYRCMALAIYKHYNC